MTGQSGAGYGGLGGTRNGAAPAGAVYGALDSPVALGSGGAGGAGGGAIVLSVTDSSTIDGTHSIDAWVKLNEPAALIEFGLLSKHVSFGFVNPARLAWSDNPPTNGATVTGRLVDDLLFLSRK